MNPLLLIPVAISFLATLLILRAWIKKAKQVNLVWEDVNKYKRPLVAGGGGISVVTGFILGILVFIAIHTFYFKSSDNIIEIFALTTSLLILAGIGLIDDLLGWKRGGLSKKFRMFMALFAAIPLIVINSGVSTIVLPFIGSINLGIFYALIAIPIGIIATSTTFNFLAGFNGLEAGQGIILFCGLGIATFLTGNSWLSLMCLLLVFSLLAFWIYNKFPAKIFPGDTLTYPIGGMIAIVAILGNIEKIAIIFFIPYVIEVFLKARGGLRKQSFGRPNKQNSLELRYKKIYGLEHLAILVLKKIKGKATEKDVVYFIYAIQLIFVLVGLLVLKQTLVI